MEQNEPTPTRALAAEIKAEKAAQGMSIKKLSEASGIPLGTLNRMLSNEPREITITQLVSLAGALGLTAAELVTKAEGRHLRMSEAAGTTDELAERRRKQDLAAAMSLEELERQKHAATRDRELDTDEPDPT